MKLGVYHKINKFNYDRIVLMMNNTRNQKNRYSRYKNRAVESKSPKYKPFWEEFLHIDRQKIGELNSFMEKYAINFNLFKDGMFIERSFPFDLIPRIIEKKEFDYLNRGIKQRVFALNLFLNDIYSKQRIIKDGIIPPEFVFSSSGYIPSFNNTTPPKSVYTHICGIDLVKDCRSKEWLILEDNLRVPSGASYPLSIRKGYRMTFPYFFENLPIEPIRFYPDMIRDAMEYVNCGGINVLLTPGRYNSAFYEHSYLAKKIGAKLVTAQDLFVEGGYVYLKSYNKKAIKVGAIYRRLDDDFLDPVEFRSDSLIGVPNLSNVYRSGNVAIMNAIGNGVGDDKGIYYFVPSMIRYYLNEEPILKNAPTYLPYFENDMKYVLENIEKLVIKDVAEAGGYGVIFGKDLTKQKLEDIKELIKREPRRFIAQEVVEFYDIDILDDNLYPTPRKCDLRMYVIGTDEIKVWAGGLTRYAIDPESYLVNSSQGGGFKDTWIMSKELMGE